MNESSPLTISPPRGREELRREAARELTQLLELHSSFSFIRLGDGEVLFLRQLQEGEKSQLYQYLDGPASIEFTRAAAGLEPVHAPRFQAALDGATFLDYCDSIPFVFEQLPKLNIQRSPALFRNQSPATSNIIFEWTYYELKDYLEQHRCLIAGAEASLLRELWQSPAYRDAAGQVLPHAAELAFHQLRDNGRHYSQNLDLIKADLRRELQRHGCDTLFLSLATGAKILCYELAQELGVRAIDFGSMARALCYAGSSGYQACRDMHNPFLFRVPFSVFMPALERARPEMSIAELAARAQAQLALEIHRHARFTFNVSDGADGGVTELTPENLAHFNRGFRDYRQLYGRRIRRDPEARRLDREFRLWYLKKEPGIAGRTFRALVQLKGWLRRTWRLVAG